MTYTDRTIVSVLRPEQATPTAHRYGGWTRAGVGEHARTIWRTACGRKIGPLAARLPWRHARLFCRPCDKCLAIAD